jgi:hypothetical protein
MDVTVFAGTDSQGAPAIGALASFYARGQRPPLMRISEGPWTPPVPSTAEREMDDFCLSVVTNMQLLVGSGVTAADPTSARMNHPSTRFATTGWQVSVSVEFPTPLAELGAGQRRFLLVRVEDRSFVYAIPTNEEIAAAAELDASVPPAHAACGRDDAIFWQEIEFPGSESVPFPQKK